MFRDIGVSGSCQVRWVVGVAAVVGCELLPCSDSSDGILTCCRAFRTVSTGPGWIIGKTDSMAVDVSKLGAIISSVITFRLNGCKPVF